tara:strand:+ start:107 stop:1168 length:1062 start_codon:yes stop_codon:yes gene_type:complete
MKLFKSYIRAMIYAYNLATFKEDKIPKLNYKDEFYKGLNQQDTQVRIFYSNQALAQNIIIFPGASPYAEEHPGVLMLGNSLSKAGYNVYLPRIPDLKKLLLSKENVDWFAHCYMELVKTKIQNKKNIMIVGLSYGGATLLRATLDKRMQITPPKSILAYGTYYSINTGLDFFINGIINYQNKTYKIKPHEWGMIVMFYNFINTLDSTMNTDLLKEILYHRINDEFDLIEQKAKSLNKAENLLLSNILEGKLTQEMRVLIDKMIDKNRDTLSFLSPEKWSKDIDKKVFIMHGANDSMVPFTESILLHENLKNSHLFISFLYEHKEISTNKGFFFKVKEFIKLINFNAQYIKYNL